jgi:hypothetical protein
LAYLRKAEGGELIQVWHIRRSNLASIARQTFRVIAITPRITANTSADIIRWAVGFVQ